MDKRKRRQTYGDIIDPETVRKSILELRRIYGEMSDDNFVTWYAGKYRVSAAAVRRVLRERGATT